MAPAENNLKDFDMTRTELDAQISADARTRLLASNEGAITTPYRNTEFLTCHACFGDLVDKVEIGDRAVIQVISRWHDQAKGNCWNHEND